MAAKWRKRRRSSQALSGLSGVEIASWEIFNFHLRRREGLQKRFDRRAKVIWEEAAMQEKWFCENCQTVFEESGRRCPQCGSRRIREAREDDLAYFCDKDTLWAAVLEDVFRQNGVDFYAKNLMGAAMTMRAGLAGELRRFYVRFDQWPLAKALYMELFSAESGDGQEE